MVCIEVLLSAIKKQFEAKFTIKDSETSQGVSGFAVKLGTLTGTTDASGIVTIGPFKKGTYSYTATHADYEDITGSLTTP